MSVEKMYFVNISGPIKELDSFVLNYIIPHEIQLVKAFSILDSVKGLSPYNEDNPYEPILKKMDSIGIRSEGNFDSGDVTKKGVDIEGLSKRLSQFEAEIGSVREERDGKIATKSRKDKIRRQILPIKNLDVEVDELFKFKHMKFRFGKMPTDSFSRLQEYVEKVQIIVYEVYEEDNEVFLVYFTPDIYQETIDSLFASLYFTRIRISDEVSGYPKDALIKLEKEIAELDQEIKVLDKQLNDYFESKREELSELYAIIENLNQVFVVRTYAAHSKEAFFLTGWITATKLNFFDEVMTQLHGFTHLVEEDDAVKKLSPPTKLNNINFFKPFETIVAMYGMPSYTELDPTVFVGITYLLMFGLMFGDIGQGFVIALFGFLLYVKKKMNIGILGAYLGVISMITGLMYGSVFGNEHFLREVFPKIPFINAMDPDNMLLVLGGTIALGVAIMLIAMVMNMVNAYRNQNMGKLLFDRNGVVGVVFYVTVLFIALRVVLGEKTEGFDVTITLPVIIIVISLFVILLSHPLQNYVNKKRKIFPDEKVGFFIESSFEVVELILAIMSNTISFMRIGAFAMNHVGFALAFRILSEMFWDTGNGVGGILVLIIGNVIIIFLEGLIVAIQCLRLEYYELFSRFFDGNGIEFQPFALKSRS